MFFLNAVSMFVMFVTQITVGVLDICGARSNVFARTWSVTQPHASHVVVNRTAKIMPEFIPEDH